MSDIVSAPHRSRKTEASRLAPRRATGHDWRISCGGRRGSGESRCQQSRRTGSTSTTRSRVRASPSCLSRTSPPTRRAMRSRWQGGKTLHMFHRGPAQGAGLSGKPEGAYTTGLLADDIAAFMQAADIEQAHLAGLSLGAAVGMWLASKHPARVKSLSLHSAWPATDPFLRVVVEGWRLVALALGQCHRHGDRGDLPLVLHPGALCRAAAVHRLPWLTSCAAARCRRWTPSCASPRRCWPMTHATRGCRVDRGADPHHVRPPRHRVLRPASPSRSRKGSTGVGGHHLRRLRARPDLRGRGRVQRPHAGIPAAPLRLACRSGYTVDPGAKPLVWMVRSRHGVDCVLDPPAGFPTAAR